MVELEKAKWPRQIIGAASMGLLLIVLGYVFNPLYERSVAHGPLWEIAEDIPLYFWMFPVSLFSVSGIWFGAWGIMAVLIASTLIYPYSLSDVPFHWFLLSVILDVLIPASAFRLLKIDLRLKTKRNIMGTGLAFLVFGVIVTTLLASWLQWRVWLNFVGFIHRYPYLTTWITSSLIIRIIIGFPVIFLCSRTVVKARAYCKGWFA